MTMPAFKHIVASTGIALFLIVTPAIAIAQNTGVGAGSNTGVGAGSNTGVGFPSGSNTGIGNGGAGSTNCGSVRCQVDNPLGSTVSACGLLKKLFNAIVSLFIPVAIVFIIIAGFRFVFAQGNPKNLAAARTNFYNTIIGIAIFLAAWLIATVIAATVNAIGGSVLISCS